MSNKEKLYKCRYCGRMFSRPCAHRCGGVYRKHNLKFDYLGLSEEGFDFDKWIENVGDKKYESLMDESLMDYPTYTTSNGEFTLYPISQTKEEQTFAPLDTQVGGDHYKKYKIQPIEFAMANKLNAGQFSVLKYVLRYKDKGGKEDLLKARHFIDLLIQIEYPNE